MSVDSLVGYAPSANSHTNLIPKGGVEDRASLREGSSLRHEKSGIKISAVGRLDDSSSFLSPTRTSLRHRSNTDSCSEQEDLDTSNDTEPPHDLLDEPRKPRTQTSALVDFLRDTGPQRSPRQVTLPMSSESSHVRNESVRQAITPVSSEHGHLLWDEPQTQSTNKLGILARAKTAVGLRRQKSEHAAVISPKRRESLSEEKKREFDVQIRTQSLTKRMLPNGKSYYTFTTNGTDNNDEPKSDPRLSSSTLRKISAPPIKLHDAPSRSTSMSSFANASIRPVVSQGSVGPISSRSSQDVKADTFRQSMSRNNSVRSVRSTNARPNRAVSVTSTEYGPTSIAECHEPEEEDSRMQARSPAMSHFSVRTAPNMSTRNLDYEATSLSFGRAPSQKESRGSLKAYLAANDEFPGLIARATSAMYDPQRASSASRASHHTTSSSLACPSPLPPMPTQAGDGDGQALYTRALARPSQSSLSRSALERNMSNAIPVTVEDNDPAAQYGPQAGHVSSGRSTAPPSPNPGSQAGTAVASMEILRPSDFAGPSNPEREHSRATSRSQSSCSPDHSRRTVPPGPLSPPRSVGKKEGAKMVQSESTAESELRQDWTMPRNQAAVKAARSSSTSITVDHDEHLLPQVLQRALSPPIRKKASRAHSRTGSLDLSGDKATATQKRVSEDETDLSASLGSATPVQRSSPLRNTVDLPASESDLQMSLESKRASTPRKIRPLSPSSTKSTKSELGPISPSSAKSEHETDGSGGRSRSNSRLLSPHQEYPSTSLEVDSRAFGLGLIRSSFGDKTDLNPSTEQRDPDAAIDRPVGTASNPAALRAALEAMRAQCMIAELRSEQEAARFRLLARRNAEALEKAQEALEAAWQSTSKGRAISGPTRSRQTKAKSLSKRQGQGISTKRTSRVEIGNELTAVIADLRAYATCNSPRECGVDTRVRNSSLPAYPGGKTSTTASPAQKGVLAVAGEDAESNSGADWVDVTQEDDINTAANQSVESNNTLSAQDDTLLGDTGASRVSSADEYDDDDMFSHRTDASTEMSRATTLEDVPGSATDSPPPKLQRGSYGSGSGASLQGPYAHECDSEAIEEMQDLPHPDMRRGRIQDSSMMPSPRSVGATSEDGMFDDDDMMNSAYDEDGPFANGGLVYSLRSTGSTPSRHGGGRGSMNRARRCESMSTIVSEDAPSSSEHGQAQDPQVLSQGGSARVWPYSPPSRSQRRPYASTDSEPKSFSVPSSPCFGNERIDASIARQDLANTKVPQHGHSSSAVVAGRKHTRSSWSGGPTASGSFLNGLDKMGSF
ncbi:unnamed protein product [Tilletia laevis]|nr:unnamed protein product [Tilletia caries]CAD6966549.1 unnamed protein product [Tilletia laevis]CAD6971380.1 unnamed protein product [Tilletia controversa]